MTPEERARRQRQIAAKYRAQEVLQAQQAPQEPFNPAEGMSAFQRGLVGAGASAARAVEGGLGAVGSVFPQARAKAEQMRGDREWFEAEGRAPLGTAGTVGGVVGAIGSAAPLALAGPAILPQMAAGAAYGGLTTPGDLGERGMGAAIEGGGAGVGNVLMRTLGRFARPAGVDSPDVTRLREAGIEPTFGQTVGSAGPGGRQIRRLEEAAMSTPFTGQMVRDRRTEALGQFQEATRRGALPPGAPEQAARSTDELRQAFKQSYDSVLADPGMRVRDLYDIEDGLLRASEAVPISTDRMQTVQRTMEGLAKRHEYAQGTNPTLKQAHAVESELEQMGLRLLRSQDGDQQAMGQVMRNLAQDFGQQWRAQAPPDVVDAIRGIDRQYAAFVPIRQAAKSAPVSMEPDEYTPNVFLRALRQTDRTPNKTEFIGGRRPQQDLGRAAEDVLSSRVPDSGTPERLMTFGAVAGAPMTGGLTMLPTLATGLYGSRGMQSYLTGRAAPDAQRRLYEALRAGRPAAAATGVGIADYMRNQ